MMVLTEQAAVPAKVEVPAVSVVMPAHNKGSVINGAIERMLSVLLTCVESCELVVVDDQSVDNPYEQLRALSRRDTPIMALRNGHNVGKGFAVKRAAGHEKKRPEITS